MFKGPGLPKSLDEEVFDVWLENGRLSKIRYNYLLIIWDAYESQYRPVYAEHRNEMEAYKTPASTDSLVAAYDLYSQSRIF